MLGFEYDAEIMTPAGVGDLMNALNAKDAAGWEFLSMVQTMVVKAESSEILQPGTPMPRPMQGWLCIFRRTGSKLPATNHDPAICEKCGQAFCCCSTA